MLASKFYLCVVCFIFEQVLESTYVYYLAFSDYSVYIYICNSGHC